MGALLLVIMLVLLAGGVWIAMTLAIVGWVGQAFFTNTLPGKNLFSAFWESNASWELAALPLLSGSFPAFSVAALLPRWHPYSCLV
jgi:hypothetical protein